MKSAGTKILLLVLALIAPGVVLAQEGFITIKGIAESVKISPSELKRIDIKAEGHDGKEHSYSGVLLSDILLKAGIILGDKAKTKNIGSYIIIRAKDNYRTIFSIPELDPMFSRKSIIVADTVDGKPLSASTGPFQVIVPEEKIHARWIRQVVSIELVTVN